MGIRFAKSIKLGDLVKINISKSGLSATIGKKGASVNLGTKGTYLNLSPTIAGIKGTGVSYRKKISGNLLSGLVGKLTSGKDDDVEQIEGKTSTSKDNKEKVDTSVVEEYAKELESLICIHKYADKVQNIDEFKKILDETESDASKEIYKLSIDGDEETIESLVGSFIGNLDLKYNVKANYELEDHDLYVDLDLPEIENLDETYPCIVKDEVVYKKKSASSLKEEYANLVMSLSAYVSACAFNLSSYIDTIIISGFTSKRNNNGDLKDEYLYSVKYTRDAFIKTDFASVDDIYNFILGFENRINYNPTTFTFKSIKPYEMASVEKANSLIDDAIAGLKELGYKNANINEIIPKLNELKLETSGEYLKEALKLLSSQN